MNVCERCGTQVQARKIRHCRPCFRATAGRPFEVRLWEKVDKSGDCWIWTGAKVGRRDEQGRGYGMLRWNGRMVPAHRLAWELSRGPIPEGLVVDHLCRNHACVNPDHLRVVTHRENILSGKGVAARFAARTHCNHGHSLEDAYPRGLGRACRTCDRLKYERRHAMGLA